MGDEERRARRIKVFYPSPHMQFSILKSSVFLTVMIVYRSNMTGIRNKSAESFHLFVMSYSIYSSYMEIEGSIYCFLHPKIKVLSNFFDPKQCS